MLVVIASETDLENEMVDLIQMFEWGLQSFHLRKPHKGIAEMEAYLSKIPKEYHQYIMMHQHHELVDKYELKGFHFQEQNRIDNEKNQIRFLKALNEAKEKNQTISSSFHEPELIQNCGLPFDYFLLSPVFDAISKKDYHGRNFEVNAIPKRIIGMGGITKNNLQEVLNKGFKGIGVLGGVWNATHPVMAFKGINESWNELIKK